MPQKISNLYLSFLVVIVSVLSVVLIQQYVMAQSVWVPPDTLPGVTPNSTFVLNPLADDLYMDDENILSANVDLMSVDANDAVVIKGDKNLCLNGECRSTWPSVTGGVIGSGDVGYIPQFIGNNEIGNSIISEVSPRRYKLNNGSFWVRNGGGSYNAMQLEFANTSATYNALYITNTSEGDGGSIKIIESDGAADSSTRNRNSIYVQNGTNGNSLYLNDTGNNYDGTPIVVDFRGYMGVGTSSPNKQLHVQTDYGNAEIGIESGWGGKHWGIYQNLDDGALRFWNYDDRLAIDSSGNVGIGINSPLAKLDVNGNVLVRGDLNVQGTATGNGGLLWSSGNDGHGSGLDADTLDGKHNGELNAQYLDGYEMQIIDDGAGGDNPKICVKSGNCNYSTSQCSPRNSVTIKHSCNTTSDCNSVCANLNPANFTCNYNCNGNASGCDTNQTDHVWGSVQCTSVTAQYCLDSSEYPPVGACVCSFSAAPVSYGSASISSTWFCAHTTAY